MYRKFVQFPVLLVVFLFGIIGWVNSSGDASQRNIVPTYSVEYSYDGVHIHNNLAPTDHEYFTSSKSDHEKDGLVAVENVESEDSEFSQKKCDHYLTFLDLSPSVPVAKWGFIQFKKRLVYYNGQRCFYPLKHLFLLFEVFRL